LIISKSVLTSISRVDSYPIGFLSDRIEGTTKEKQTYLVLRSPGQPSSRSVACAVGNGRLWVMEQQPGPVNWAPTTLPLPGMACLWAWVFAHGAEVVWLLLASGLFVQEQMHAGRCAPDMNLPCLWARLRRSQNAAMPDIDHATGSAALTFDYESAWAWDTQPQART
jgi:beta-galactosidase